MGKPNDLRKAVVAAGRHNFVVDGPEWGDSDIDIDGNECLDWALKYDTSLRCSQRLCLGMASQWCRYCRVTMDPCDGHRECPHCLGVAHLVEDIENPCPAAAELFLEERRCRAKLVEETARNKMAAHPPPSKTKEGRHASKQSKRHKRDHSPDHYHSGKSAHKRQLSPEKRGQQEDTQIQILAAIQSLSNQLTRIEAQRPVAGSSSGIQEPSMASQHDLPPYQSERQGSPDVLSLYAHSSFGGSAGLSGNAEEEKLNSSLGGLESDLGTIPDNETPAQDVMGKISSAAKSVVSQFWQRLRVQ
ncbi:hypothetical protein ABVT39_018140 [Epinephelus coioides]